MVRRAVGIMMWERAGQLRSKEREIKEGGEVKKAAATSPRMSPPPSSEGS